MTPDTVIATVNEKPFTVGDLEALAVDLPKDVRDLAGTKPKEFLEQYALSLNLQSEAERRKLPQTPPYRQKLEAARRQILVQGLLEEVRKTAPVDPAALRKTYEERIDDYRQAEARVIFVSRVGYRTSLNGQGAQETTPEQAKARALKAVEELRAGKDFLAAAREYSDDDSSAKKEARFPYPIRAKGNVPAEIRTAVLAAKEGDIVGPVEHATGWYIFRPDSFSTATFEAIRPELEKELREAALKKFLDEQRARSTAVLKNEPFWTTFLETNKQAMKAAEAAAEKVQQ
ncbi:MAG TPA: peptidylprolyl isomerase [Bryobacteraceae bacterium]|nr:peptidylprolyl isomerase [Bryobacteraceae bacterium]